MGQFINQLADNARYERHFVSLKQKELYLKQQEQKNKKLEQSYKQSFLQAKKEVLLLLYSNFEEIYKNKSINAYYYINFTKIRIKLIDDILKNYKSFLKNEEITELKILLNQKYLTYNKQLYNLYNADIISKAQEEQEQEQEQKDKKSKFITLAQCFQAIFVGFSIGLKSSKYDHKKFFNG